MKRLSIILPLLVVCALVAMPAVADKRAELLDEAESLLAQERADDALGRIDEAIGRAKPSGRALLLRSTARFMRGEHEQGAADLRRALDLDPSLRQGWLNLGAVEMSVQRYDAAYEALRTAERLAPDADDNDLNLGAVQLLRSQRGDADARFARYLAARPSDAAACLLVAGNYALAGDADAAIDHLAAAIEVDERARLRIRADRKFDYFHLDRFRRLMNTDGYRPPDAAHTASAAFRVTYDRGDPELVDAVTQALSANGLRYEPTIEATDGWALIWGDLRIKIANQGDGTGSVTLSAPADRFTEEQWHRVTQALFRNIHAYVSR